VAVLRLLQLSVYSAVMVPEAVFAVGACREAVGWFFKEDGLAAACCSCEGCIARAASASGLLPVRPAMPADHRPVKVERW
jgi:hypothetical protein